MQRNMPKKDNTTFFLRPPRDVINRLDALSKKFKRDSANQVAVEILRDYAELWAAAEQAKYDTISRQQDAVTRAIKAEALRQPLHEAIAEHGKRDSQTRKRNK